MTSPPHSDDRADDDDDLIAIVRAGLHDLQPDVTHRVDHHRFWRDGQRRRQRRVVLVTASVVVTLAAVLVPLTLVALPGDHDDHLPEVLARPVATGVASHAPAPLTAAALVAALQAAEPAAAVRASKVLAGGSVVAGSAVVQHVNGFVQLGQPGTGLSLEVNAYRVSPTPSGAAVLAYLQDVTVANLIATPSGGGTYWVPRSGNVGLAGALSSGGTVAAIVGTLPPGSTDTTELRDLAQSIAKGLAASSL